MEKKKNVSMAVIKRLPKYHRYLKELMRNDVDRISSKELGEKIGFTASQIRQDLNNFGDFGQQGYGYNVKELYKQISLMGEFLNSAQFSPDGKSILVSASPEAFNGIGKNGLVSSPCPLTILRTKPH